MCDLSFGRGQAHFVLVGGDDPRIRRLEDELSAIHGVIVESVDHWSEAFTPAYGRMVIFVGSSLPAVLVLIKELEAEDMGQPFGVALSGLTDVAATVLLAHGASFVVDADSSATALYRCVGAVRGKMQRLYRRRPQSAPVAT
jgi:hypothetical protein